MRQLTAPREEDFSSRLRGPAVAARVGLWLGVCFAVAFLTGLYSHFSQTGTVPVPTGPVWLYRVTQGVHVLAGTAAVPLLLVKLWSVYHRLFARPPRRPVRQVLAHLAERASIAVLVSSALFQLATGLANSAQWYPWGFGFRPTHYALAWVALGSLAVHVAVKLPVVREALAGPVDGTPGEDTGGGVPRPSRRSLLRATWLGAAVAVLATAGASVPALRRVSVLAVRSGEGPQGVPVNRSAAAAGVLGTADDPGYRLTVTAGDRSASLSLADLAALPQAEATLPIACVEGWSASGTWGGVRVRDLVALVADDGRPHAVRVTSLQRRGHYRQNVIPADFVAHDDTLLALRLAGEPLDLDHGYPCRVIAPARPGVLQTKWVSGLEVVA